MTVRLALTLLLALAPGIALAQQRTPIETARALYASGNQAFEERRFADAARAFREAHAITHQPELLYNLALAQVGADDPAGALESLTLFRDAGAPGAPDRAALDRQIDELRAEAERRRQSAQTAPAPVQVVERHIIEPRWVRVEYRTERPAIHTYGPWITLGLGVAVGAVGGVMGIIAADHASVAADVNRGNTRWSTEAQSAFNDGPGAVTMAWVLGATGGALVTAGVLWLALRGPGERREVRVGMTVAPTLSGGAALVLGGVL